MKDDVHRLQEKFKETYEGTQAGSPGSKGLLIGPISSTYQIGVLDLGLGVWLFVRSSKFLDEGSVCSGTVVPCRFSD